MSKIIRIIMDLILKYIFLLVFYVYFIKLLKLKNINMYTFIFYVIVVSIIVSLFFKYNSDFLKPANLAKINKQIEKIEIVTKKTTVYSYDERINRWDYYLGEWFLDLASTEYSNALLEKVDPIAYKKLANTQILLWSFTKAETNLLSAIEIMSSDDLILDLIKLKVKLWDFNSATELIQKIEIPSYEKNYLIYILWLLWKDFETSRSDVEYLIWIMEDEYILNKLIIIQNAFFEFDSYRDWKPEHLELLIAKALSNIEEYEISLKLIRDVLEMKPAYRDAWIMLWYNNLRIWNDEIALMNFQKAYDLDSTKAETLFYLWLVNENLWKKVLASDYFKRSLDNEYEPRSHIIQHLAELSAENWDDELSVEMYREMLSLNSDDIRNFYYPINILINRLKDYETALKFAQWAERRHSDKAFTYSLLWWAYLVNDDVENSKLNIQKSIQMDSSIPNNYLYAWMLSEKIWDNIAALRQYSIAYRKDINWKIWRESVESYNELLKNVN